MPESSEEAGLHFLDYWRVIRSRKEVILAVTLLVVITGTAFTFTLPKIYLGETRMDVRQDALDIDVFEREYIQGYNPFFLRTQFEIIQSKSILHPVIKNLDLQRVWGKDRNEDGSPLTLEQTFSELRRSVKVDLSRDTSLIAIQVSREDPQEAARLANQIAEVYRDYRLSLKRNEIKRAVDVLNNQLEKQQERVNQAETELENIRKTLGVNIMQQGLHADKLRLQQLEADRISARVEMLVRQARLDQLHSLEGEELMNAASYLVNDQALMAIRRQLIDSEVSLKLLLENFGVNHPEVRRVQAAVDELRSQLTAALAGLKRGLSADYEVARAKFDALESELSAAKASDITAEREQFLPFQKADRELNIQRSILNAVQARVAQEGIELEVPRTPVEIVDEAEAPTQPISPNFMLNIILSLVLGLSAGIGLAYFIEYLDTSVKTVEDIEKFLGLPVIGIIPQKVRYLMEEGPGSPYAESYRVLRTNIQLGHKGRSSGTSGGSALAVCSGGVGEGKSTTLANLAYVCAQLGDKVLVVDSDLRRPVQHHIFGMSNRTGLTDVLMRDVPVEEMIQATSIPNLHFLPSGKLSRSMVGLLDSQRMRDLVKNLKARYDFVFFDTPPLMGVSDASILASEMDGVLLVVQYRKYPRIISSRAKRILDSVGVTIYGVVLNNINIMRDDYYYYYHSYYSHYNQPEESNPEAAPAPSSSTKKEQLL